MDESGIAIILPRATPLAAVSMAGGPVSSLPVLAITVCAKTLVGPATTPQRRSACVAFAAGDPDSLTSNICMIDSDGDTLLDQFAGRKRQRQAPFEADAANGHHDPAPACKRHLAGNPDPPIEGVGGISNRMISVR